MTSLTSDPYPKPGSNLKARLLVPFEKALKEFEELDDKTKNDKTDHIKITRLRYYESFFKRLTENGELDLGKFSSFRNGTVSQRQYQNL